MKWTWLAEFPTQQALGFTTILMWVPTCICSLTGCHINEAWYGTLLGLTFAAVLHYGIKRWSFRPGGPQDVETTGA